MAALVCGRLAPSPTGLLHMGNAWAFLLAWLSARAQGGRVLLRMEDIDPARSREEWAQHIESDLAWLGLDWDERFSQSSHVLAYEQALATLKAQGKAYPCYCTRKQLRLGFAEMQALAGAPQAGYGDSGVAYPGTCRHASPETLRAAAASGRKATWRLACPEQPEEQGFTQCFNDLVCGPQSMSLSECGGDFALRRSDGVWAYQLAVSVDDASISEVVRGEDILSSTPRQLYLLELLGHKAPLYAHIPLLHDAEGERLAKRHCSLTLNSLREAGISAKAVLGYLAQLAGLQNSASPVGSWELVEALRAAGKGFPWPLLARHRDHKLMLPEQVRELFP